MSKSGVILYLPAIFAIAAAYAAPARAELFIVAPNANAATEGNGGNNIPFNEAAALRYQQVYSASQFSALSGPQYVTEILFRPDQDSFIGPPFSATLSDVQVDLSTTSAAPDGLSATFANNIGADDTVVYSGALSLSSAATGPAGGPKNFDIAIILATPFLYDPTAGNLLLDIRNFGGGSTVGFDTQFATGDSISRVEGLVTDTTGSRDSEGLVTEFEFSSAAPEPSSMLLCLAAFAGAFLVQRRKRRQAATLPAR